MRGGRTAIGLGIGLAIAVLTGLAANAVARSNDPIEIPITIHYSHYEPASVTVPVGRPVTFVITNTDPIDHEWIVGDAAVQQRHRVGTEVVHDAIPTEQMIPAGETRVTTITFAQTGSLQYICHLPGHEAYGMVGVVMIR